MRWNDEEDDATLCDAVKSTSFRLCTGKMTMTNARTFWRVEVTCLGSLPVQILDRWTRRPSSSVTRWRTTVSAARRRTTQCTHRAGCLRSVIRRSSYPEVGRGACLSHTTRTTSRISTICCEQTDSIGKTYRFSSPMVPMLLKVSITEIYHSKKDKALDEVLI